MSLFINTQTNEYPRHIGDVELAPNEPWEPVVETPEPEHIEGYRWVEGQPECRDGVWHRTWLSIPRVPLAE